MSTKNRINKFLERINLELHGTGYMQSLRKGNFKSDEFQFFKEIFNLPEVVIFDVGANRGTMIHKFKVVFPESSIYAFEPYPPLFKELKDACMNYNDIQLINNGVSSKNGNMIFNVNRGIDTSSFLPPHKTGLNCDKQVECIDQIDLPVITLDTFVETQEIKKINILKLDIQGSELNALKGAERLLAENKIDLIYTETYFIKQYIDQPLFSEIASFLSKFEYEIQDIYNPIYGKGKLAWCDTVFVKKGLM